MHSFAAVSALFALVSSIGQANADVHAPVHRRHHRSLFGDSSLEKRAHEFHLEKRVDNARFTFFDDGMGACGTMNTASDFIVALNSGQYEGGSHCYQMITITANGKTTQAQITDECPGCPYGGLDFSRGLFDFFADESVGELYGTWNFGSGNPTTSSSSSQWTPTSTWWQPTTTWTPDWTSTSSSWSSSSSWKPTSTWSSSSSSSWSSSSSSSSTTPSSSSSAASSSASASSSALPAVPTASEQDPENLSQFALAIMNLAGVIVAGAQATA